MCVCIYVCVYVYVYIYIYVCVCVCICVYVFIIIVNTVLSSIFSSLMYTQHPILTEKHRIVEIFADLLKKKN